MVARLPHGLPSSVAGSQVFDPGSVPWERARAVLAKRLRRIARDDHRNGFKRIADDVRDGHATEIQSWIVLEMLAGLLATQEPLPCRDRLQSTRPRSGFKPAQGE